MVDEGLADCGKPEFGAAADGRIGEFNVFVRRGDQQQTVTVNTRYAERRVSTAGPYQATSAPCYSTGQLERQILDSLSSR